MSGVKYKGKSLDAIASDIESFVSRKQKTFLLGLWNDLVDGTPVDTGAARSNWTLSPDKPLLTLNPKDGTQYARPDEPSVGDFPYVNKTWYIANMSPYVLYLNEGHFWAAGWIDTSIQRNLVKFSIEK